MRHRKLSVWTCTLIALLLVTTVNVADAKKKKQKQKGKHTAAREKPQLTTQFAALETVPVDARCQNCSPLLSVPWGDFHGSDASTGCPADAWNSPGNEWLHCGLAGEWEQLWRDGKHGKQCSFSRVLRALSWCWKPAHPACMLDALSVLQARNETIVLVGDSMTAQVAVAMEMLLRDAFPNATACHNEFAATTANVQYCIKLPSGFRVVQVAAKMDFANKTLSVLLPDEAARCRKLMATKGYMGLGTKWMLRSEYPEMSCFEFSWVSILPYADVLVLNYGLWNYAMEVKSLREYDAMAGGIMRHIKKKFRGRKFLYRITFVGHYETCKQPTSYLTPLSQPRRRIPPGQDDVYRYFSMVDYEHSWVAHAKRNNVPMHFLNVTGMFSQRIDGKRDCNHYCNLGPQLWAARIVLMTALA